MDWKLASFEIGERVTVRDLDEFGDRVQLLPTGRYLLRKYVKFQSGNLSETCPAHKPILKLVQLHGLVETSIGYQYPMARVSDWIAYGYPIAYPIARVQEERKEKEKEKKEGGLGEGLKMPEKFSKCPEFLAKWGSWVKVRLAKKGCKDFNTMFQEQLDWLDTFTVPQAIESLSQSIRGNWQGLFEPRGINGNSHKPSQGELSGIDKSILLDEKRTIVARLTTIENQYDGHQTMDARDLAEKKRKKARLAEINSLLGTTV